MVTAENGARRVSPAAWVLILPIRFYQKFITPYTPATCRYYPTCSAYAVGALRTHGAIKGLLLGAWRLLRCNPWSSGGVDMVPPHGRWRTPREGPGADDTVIPVVSVQGSAPGAARAARESTNGDGAHAATETARPCGAGAPSAGRNAA